MQSPAPLTVLGLVALATTAIVCGDTAGKLLTGAGVQPLFVAWSRFALAALLLAVGWFGGLYQSGNYHAVLPGELYRSAQLSGEELSDRIARDGIRKTISLPGKA